MLRAVPFIALWLPACHAASDHPIAEPPPEALGCSVYPQGGGPLKLLEGCAHLDPSGRLQVTPEALAELSFEGDLSRLYLGEVHRWFYVNRQGLGLSCLEEGFDCAPFRDGLTSGVLDGEAVFYGPDLEVVFSTGLDWAGSFADGLAPVCEGVPSSPGGGGDCDQGARAGGRCGYVDADGRMVLHPSVPLEALPARDEVQL